MRFSGNVGLTFKLIAFLLLSVIGFVGFVIFLSVQQEAMTQQIELRLQATQDELIGNYEYLQKVGELVGLAQGLVSESNPDLLTEKLKALKSKEDAFTSKIEQCRSGCGSIKEKMNDLLKTYQTAIDFAMRGNNADSFALFTTDVAHHLASFQAELSRKNREALDSIAAQNEASKGNLIERIRILQAIGVIWILIFIAYGLFISQFFRRAMRNLSASLNAAGSSLHQSSSSISTASQQLSMDSSSAAGSLRDVSAGVSEVNLLAEQGAKQSLKAAQLAEQSASVASAGGEKLRELIVSIQAVFSSSQRIHEISSTLQDISFQTNLLALNAAVEAARAGEYGRGFAVVADAVRSLSQRSSESSKTISEMIKDSVEKISMSKKLADESEHFLNDILESSHSMKDISEDLAQDSEKQSVCLNGFDRALKNFESTIHNNAATSEELAASSDQLMAQAGSLNSALEGMRAAL